MNVISELIKDFKSEGLNDMAVCLELNRGVDKNGEPYYPDKNIIIPLWANSLLSKCEWGKIRFYRDKYKCQ